MKDEEKALWQRYIRRRTTGNRNRVIERYTAMTVAIASAMTYDKRTLDDVVQEAHIGLIRAVEKFRLSEGVEFATYAAKAIRGKILDYFERKNRETSIEDLGPQDRMKAMIYEDKSPEFNEFSAMELINMVADERTRNAMILRFICGFSFRRTGRVFGLSGERIGQIIKNGIEIIRQKVNR